MDGFFKEMASKEARTFRRAPVYSVVVWTLVLLFAVTTFWLMIAGPSGVASTLFSTEDPSLLQMVAAVAAAMFPVTGFILYGVYHKLRGIGRRERRNIEVMVDGKTATMGSVLDAALRGDRDSVQVREHEEGKD